jgi:hypothetical protein
MVHELSHAVVYTKDLTYKRDEIKKWAITNPEKTVISAKAYEAYVETMPFTIEISGYNGLKFSGEKGTVCNSLIYCKPSGTQLSFTVDYSLDSCTPYIKAPAGTLYLNSRATGAVILYDSPKNFRIEYIGGGAYTIYSIDTK